MSAIPNYLEQAWRPSEKELDDVEVVVDLRDGDADVARASTASSASGAFTSRNLSPNSPSHIYEIDLCGVLQALTSEVAGDEAEDLFPSLRLYSIEPDSEDLPFDSWLGSLSQRSSAISVHSDEVELLAPCSPDATQSGEASSASCQEADLELQEEILQSVEPTTGTLAGDFSDAQPMGGVAEDLISVVDDEAEVDPQPNASARPLETTVASLLRRLSLDQDESVASSIRGVLEFSDLLEMCDLNCHLTEEEIEALPSFPYQCKEQQQCAICLETFQEAEVVTMLRCSHFFHTACVATWMHQASKCPLCRAYV